MKSSIGIYFGSRVVTLVESEGRKILNNIHIARSSFLNQELEDKVPDELKMVMLFKDALRANKIEAKEASIALSGRDLIIRTFELPLLPAEELAGAVNFEAKKYIPFKVEELVSVFQTQFDKLNRKNLVLFVGIKKETLGKYLSVLSQLDIKSSLIEYSVFSILRFLQTAEVGREINRGTIGIMSMDFQEENEVNFVVLDDGFPLFSRDITLIGRPDDLGQTEKIDLGVILEKLKTEIRISLDYYDRKFPNKNIDKTFIIASQDSRSDLDALFKEVGLSVKFVDPALHLDKPIPFNMSFLKGYGCSLSKKLKIGPNKIDLMAAKVRIKTGKEGAIAQKDKLAFLSDLKIDMRIVIGCLFFCVAVFGFGIYRIQPLEQELNRIISMRPQLPPMVNPENGYEELRSIKDEYNKKLGAMDSLIRKQLYLTEQLQVIPGIMPEGMWLTRYSFMKDQTKVELSLEGNVYAGSGDKEFDLVNVFFGALKSNSAFSKYFKEITIVSVDRKEVDNTSVTQFVISCRGPSG